MNGNDVLMRRSQFGCVGFVTPLTVFMLVAPMASSLLEIRRV